MSEKDKATGGYVICGKPYIIGDDPDEWKGFPAPKMNNDTKISIEISAPSDFDPEIARNAVKHLIAGGIDITNG